MSLSASPEQLVLDELVTSLRAMPDQEMQRFLVTLDPLELAAVESAITRVEIGSAEWRETPITMAHYLTNGRIRKWRYMQFLGEKFKDAMEGRSKRQIWMMPSRYGKTTALRWGCAWVLDRDPSFPLIWVSYGDQLAVESAVGIRDILREHKGSLRAALRRDRQRQDRFVTTEGGGILAGGIMSGLTGFGSRGLIFDDPFKDWQEAHSQARRDLVDNQARAVLSLRLETEDAWSIVCATRWHEDDLSGRFIKRMEDGTGEEWEVVRIPAIAEPIDPTSADYVMRLPDPLGREPGEVIEPERFSLEAVLQRHLALGSYLVAGLEQQRPAPEEGGEVKRAWFRLDDNLPAEADEWITSWDMTMKAKETGDWVVGQTWARASGGYWLTAQLRGQWNQPTVENAIALAAVREPRCRAHIVENTGNGPEVMTSLREAKPDYVVSDEIADVLGMSAEERIAVQNLRRRGLPNVLPENVKGSKTVRARAISGVIEAGSVHLWARAPWLGTFLDEVASFPNGAHDDQVDAMSQALKRLRGGTAQVSAALGQLPKTPIATNASVSRPAGLPSYGNRYF